MAINNDLIRAQANQDHDLAAIRETWGATDSVAQDELLTWLDDRDPETSRASMATFPDLWILFIQTCAACGLRQMEINRQASEE